MRNMRKSHRNKILQQIQFHFILNCYECPITSFQTSRSYLNIPFLIPCIVYINQNYQDLFVNSLLGSNQQFSQQMSDLHETMKYSRLHSQLLKFEPAQILPRLLEEISLNQSKSLQILRLQNRISELQAELRNLLSSSQFGNSKSRVKMNHSYSQQMDNLMNTLVKQCGSCSKWQQKTKQLHEQITLCTKQSGLMREQFKQKYEQLHSERDASLQTIQRLRQQNQGLKETIKQTTFDVKELSAEHQKIKQELKTLKSSERTLSQVNSQLLQDEGDMLEQYKKSVLIIETIMKELDTIRQQNDQKSIQLKEITNKNTYLDMHINHCVKQIQKYQRILEQANINDKQYLQINSRLEEARKDQQLIIKRLQIQNLQFRQALQIEVKRSLEFDDVTKELRTINLLLESRIQLLEENQGKIIKIAKEKEQEVEDLKKMQRDRVTELRLKISELEEGNQNIKQQLLLNNRQLEYQIQTQLKTINQYEQASKPKLNRQLSSIKQRLKGEEKHKEFRLGQFQMKVHLDHSQLLRLQQNCVNKGKQNRMEASQGYCQRIKSKYGGLSSKVTDLSDRVSSKSQNMMI